LPLLHLNAYYIHIVVTDFDECENNLELCKNGQCLNDAGSFHCECDMGFSPTSDRQACEGNIRFYIYILTIRGCSYIYL